MKYLETTASNLGRDSGTLSTPLSGYPLILSRFKRKAGTTPETISNNILYKYKLPT